MVDLEKTLHLPPGNERKIILVAALTGIVLFLVYLRRKNTSAATLPFVTPSGGGGGGSSSGTGAGLTELEKRIAGLENLNSLGNRAFEFDFGADYSSSFMATGERGTSRGGRSSGINLGIGNSSLGVSSSRGGSSNSRTGAFQNVNRDIQTMRVSGVGYSSNEIERFLMSIIGLAGGYEQHAQHQLLHSAANSSLTERYLGGQVLTSDMEMRRAGLDPTRDYRFGRRPTWQGSGSADTAPGSMREPRILPRPSQTNPNDILIPANRRFRPGSREWRQQRYGEVA